MSNVQDISDKYLYNKCIIDAGLLGGSFGMILGMLFTEGSTVDLEKYGETVRKMTRLKRLVRVIAMVACPLVVFAITFIVF